MGSNILISVFILPLLSAVSLLFFWGRVRTQKVIGGVFISLYLVASVIQFVFVKSSGSITLDVGSWPAGIGIGFIVDLLSAFFVLLTSVVAFLSYFYVTSSSNSSSKISVFLPVFFFLIFGLNGAFIAADLFNLYVWFEVMIVSSFVLFTLGGKRAQLEGSLKYVAINVFSSSIFLAGIGILYGITGSLNMQMIGSNLPLVENRMLVSIAVTFFVVSFGIKAAIFPLFFWLPSTYHTAPVGYTALVVALLTKVGIYALLRFFTVIFPLQGTLFQPILLVLSGFTMVVGVLGAAAQTDFRKILSFHIVSQIGYMLMGIAIYTPLAIAGAVFFVVHNVLVKTNLFLVSGLVNKLFGSYKLKELGGVYRKFPFIALLFALSAFSLTGIPPLSGFWGKYILAVAGFSANQWLPVTVTAISLGVSLLTLFSMTKIWNEVFWKPNPQVVEPNFPRQSFIIEVVKQYPGMFFSIVTLTVLILILGIFPNSIIEVCMEISNSFFHK